MTVVAHNVGSIGGMERQLAELIGGLLARDHRVTVIARRCELPPHPRLRFVRVRGPARPFTLAFPWFLVAGTIAAWRHRDAVLHTTGALVLNSSDVVSVHFCNEAVRKRKGLIRARKQSPLYRANGWIAVWMGRKVERFCYRPHRIRRLVAVSAGIERELSSFFPDMRPRLRTIANGVDATEFRPQAAVRADTRKHLGLGARQLVALFAAGEWEGKGLRHAIEGVARSPSWSLLVVGRGDRPRFEALASAQGAGTRVQFVGPTDEIARYYQAADAFVLPSGYEAFPLVALEAAAAGLPLLATRVNGVEDLLEHGVNGWFVEPSGHDIARRLIELEASDARRTAMAAAARETAMRYPWSSVVKSYEGLYAELAAEAGSRDPQLTTRGSAPTRV